MIAIEEGRCNVDVVATLKQHTARPTQRLFAWCLMLSLTLFPQHNVQKKIAPVLKAPRPHKLSLSGTGLHLKGKAPTRRGHDFDPFILAAADRHRVDPALVKAIIMAESNYHPIAISKNGASGLVQLMSGTADAMGVQDLINPEHDIDAVVIYLKILLIHVKLLV